MVTTITSVAVVGAGYMGGGIAQSLALAGLPVTIADVSADATSAAYERLLIEARDFEDAGLFDVGAAEKIRANLRTASSIEEAVADVDFVEEAVFESVEVKHEVLSRISAAARPEAIIGSNTSTIPARVLGTVVKHPERFLTVHFSNPAPFIPGVELVLGEHTDEAIVPVVKELLTTAGRQAALVADVPGFVLNRLQYVLLKEAMSIAEEGIASPEDIDTVVRTTFGFRLGFFGPFAIADQAGLDVYASGFRTFEEAFGERLATPQLVQDAVASDRRGVKNGKGLLRDYTPEEVKALVAHRNRAYSEMGRLVRSLGSTPA
ncbi:3-hydroxyacyl-CoA dehydrogenase family protein [Xylanimonas ulmi]|nr:3-hydroxyacyl-CoA dehydrogenase family protein [Xylanibacterium ulmi]